MPRVLVADDDDGVRFTLVELLSELEVEVREAADGEAAWAVLESEEIDLLITDLRMPRLDGMGLLARVHAQLPHVKVVMLTAHGSEEAAVQAMKAGAFDYFAKPFDVDQVADAVRRATETARLLAENRALRAQLALGRHMVFRSEAMLRVAHLVERAGPRDVTVLITGESGTGKERVADALVEASPRRDRPFVKFNCAAIPREVAEDELFGHAPGAFTGATRARTGLFREAHQGTVLLDEIGELDLTVQGKLLRVLQEGELRPVGEDRPQRVDVRIIAATHRDLLAEVKAGRFREDLYFRLNVLPIHLPPLADRPEDLEPLVEHFVKKYAERFGLERPRLTEGARSRLLTHRYRGNVRELENAVERLVALSSGDTIDDLEPTGDAPPALTLKQRVEAYERGLIVGTLQETGGNRSEAARRLGVGRVTLLDKLKKYGLAE
ncbi:MAG: sigma-54-dependent Fis family transcriptional regulator [Myxococcales bacterium]|nr:sigma-54-dependent Fis family transcriptional regulator [Myxococcales bacterium]